MIDSIASMFRQVGFAVRSLRRSPGFALIAIVTLGLGIGANTSMFSVLNGYLLRPAPYPDSARLERIYRATPRDDRGGIAPADYVEMKAALQGYGEIAAYTDFPMSLSEAGKPAEMTVGMRASANLFTTLGTAPRLGRGFRPGDDVPGNHRVLVLSDRYWQKRYGGDPAVIGHTVHVDGEPYEIVGVLPANFSDWRHLSWVDVFRPLALDAKESRDRGATWLRLVGRRGDGVSPAQAAGLVADFGRRLAHDYPNADADSSWHTVSIDRSFLPDGGRNIIGMLVGLSGFVLLIACSNLANLLLARTMARAREFALRGALGASRRRLLGPLFVESLLLALAGGGLALVVARWTFNWLEVHSAGDNGVGVALQFDWHVLGWTFGACLFTVFAFGVAPALFALRLDLNSTLKSGSRGTTAGRGHQRFRNLLVVGQLALATILLAGAALFARGLHEANNRRHGWQSDGLVTTTVVLPAVKYPGDAEIADFQRRALERLEALPGVASASASYAMPFFGLSEPRRYVVAGRETPQPGREPAAVINGVSPHYFETVGTRLESGRTFDQRDSLDAPKVFIINRAMARHLFPGQSPLGQRLAPAGGRARDWGEIVGVVDDVESVFTGELTPPFQLYQPLAQEPRREAEIAVRSAGVAPKAVIEGIRTAMMALDADLPLRKLQPAATTIARATYQDGVLASVLSGLAMLGLGLASLGIYGVIARTTAQRKGEFGIRLALGAVARDIIRLVLASGARLALVGSAIGLLGAYAISRGIAAYFPAMNTGSGFVLPAVTLLLVAIALLACYVPARVAARTRPSATVWGE